MKITQLSSQVRNPDRINVFIDGKFRFSLDISQITDLNIKLGRELDDQELLELENESQFGKLYSRSLEYCLIRPRSVSEVRDYLYRKTLANRYKDKKGQIREKQGYSPILLPRVIEKLQQRSYLDDRKFAIWWVENRFQRKGISARKLSIELRAKGIDSVEIEEILRESGREDYDELRKMITKKQQRYTDPQKLIAYLVRQGFGYDDIKAALSED